MEIKNLEVEKGSLSFEGQVLDENDKPVNISNSLLWMTVKENYNDADSFSLFQLVLGNGIQITDSINGKYKISITSDHLSLGIIDKEYWYDIKISINGIIQPILKGNFIIRWSVTKSSTYIDKNPQQVKSVKNIFIKRLSIGGDIVFKSSDDITSYGSLDLSTNVFTVQGNSVAKNLKISVEGGTPASITGTELETFDIVAGVNDKFKIDVNNYDMCVITLAAGTGLTAANIASDLQTKFDAFYGSGVVVVEAVSGQIKISSALYGSGSEIEIMTIEYNCYTELGFVVGVYSGSGDQLDLMYGDVVKITYESNSSVLVNLDVYLPKVSQSTVLYVSQDGSTFYDSALTQVAASKY